MGWFPFFEGCIAVKWAGLQETHYVWLGWHNTGERWAASLVVKLLDIAWDLWDHRNQIKFNLKMAQDIAWRDSILQAVHSEYAFGRSSLPHWDWCLIKCPLVSFLANSLHYLDAWLLRIKLLVLDKSEERLMSLILYCHNF
jgi:hypothetical protein